MLKPLKVLVLNVSELNYPERLCAASLQGLLNRQGPKLYLDYGIYDDPAARRTNEVFLDDELWFNKYRALLGNQDQNNLEYYTQEHHFEFHITTLDDLIKQNLSTIQGYVVWETGLFETANIALMLSAQTNLLPITVEMEAWAKSLGLSRVDDLTGRWKDPISLYQWAFEHLAPKCLPGKIACVEPGWKRPEFVDYLVQQKIFTYSLKSSEKGLGSTLLMLLAFGPAWLRELIFALRLDGMIRRFALAWMGRKSPEVRLSNQIQQTLKSETYPTIFGWHTCRDDELAFMLQLSANGLRLVPSHIAGNYSFHSQVKPLGAPQPQKTPPVSLDPNGVYLTFTLSDGDQLMMMHTGELGNWYSPSRGKYPFNWETQPLLVELAPALLEKYQRTATSMDCLIAGPSGAGYVIPPLVPDLPAYLRETAKTCCAAGIRVVTSYIADPPERVLHQLAAHKGGLIGYLTGYAVLGRAPMRLIKGTPIVSNQSPLVVEIPLSAGKILAAVKQRIEAPGNTPRFVGVHLFAYRTTLDDVVGFLEGLNQPNLHIVRADEFLELAKQSMRRK
jgi:hypothetical protein